jgi:polyhydroxyalkanoate synthesis regulator phasin
MSSQVTSYRLNTEEVLVLRQKALPGESDNQTAQRLMRESLGMSTDLSTTSTTNLDERIKSVIEDRLSSFAAHQNELLSRLQERLQQLETQVAKLSLPSDHPPFSPVVDTVGTVDRLLTQAELAKRLEVDPGTLTKNRSKPNFPDWSGDKDPENINWRYLSELKRYTPMLSTTLSIKSTK